MEEAEKALQALSLVAIVVLTAVVFDLISEPDEDVEVVYVMVDNRIVFEENTTVIELDRSEVARIASFNIKVFGDTKMSNAVVVAELVELFQAYDMVAVQEIKDIDEEVPYLFLDELNGVAGQGNVTDQTLNWSMVLSERGRPTGGRQDLAGTVCLLLPAHGVQALDNGTLYDDSTNDSFQRALHGLLHAPGSFGRGHRNGPGHRERPHQADLGGRGDECAW